MDDRRGDWQQGVDQNLASLNAGQLVWSHEQKAMRKLLREIDDDLRGSIGKETDGMIGRLRDAETKINMLLSVLDMDRAGNKGLVTRVEKLELREKTSDTRLKIWIAVIGLLSAFLSAAVFNIDKIETFLNRKSKDPVDQMIERAAHPKARHRHVVIRQIPETPTED